MISRVAEACFWLHRYVERAEAVARLLGAAVLGGDASTPVGQRWRPVLIATGELPRFLEIHGADAVEDRDRVLEYLTWSEHSPVSIHESWRAARENARVIREAISRDTWEVTNRTWLWLESAEARARWAEDAAEFYREVRDAGQLFAGATAGTMLHDEPLWFMQLGMYLERAGQVARLIDVTHHAIGPTARDKAEGVDELAAWVQVLTAAGVYDSFFRRNRGTVRGYRAARFLVFDERLPRSIAYSLDRAREILEREQKATPDQPLEALIRVDKLSNWLLNVGWEGLIEYGVHQGMTRVVDEVAEVCTALYDDFFSPPLPSKPPT